MRISSGLKLVAAGGLMACFGALGLVSPNRAYGVVAPPSCNICPCKNVNGYIAQGAAPVPATWFFKDNGDGSFTLSTQAFVTLQTINTCDKGTPTNADPALTVTMQDGPAVCAPIPPPPGQTIYLEVALPKGPLLPPTKAMPIQRLGCLP